MITSWRAKGCLHVTSSGRRSFRSGDGAAEHTAVYRGPAAKPKCRTCGQRIRRATFAARVGVELTLSARYRLRRGPPYRVAAPERGSIRRSEGIFLMVPKIFSPFARITPCVLLQVVVTCLLRVVDEDLRQRSGQADWKL